MNRRTGFTLLEVLLATTLMAAVTAATFSWVATQTRTNRSAAQRLQALTTSDLIATAIRDDLMQTLADEHGQRFDLQKQHLSMTTLNRMPSDAPGLHHVVWRQDDKLGALVREIILDDPKAPPSIRPVSRQLHLVRFFRRGSGGLPTLICRADGQEQEISVPLAIAGMP